jgi:hypothetical protein
MTTIYVRTDILSSPTVPSSDVLFLLVPRSADWNHNFAKRQSYGSSHTTPRKPVHELRLGRLKAAIWENPTDNGVRYNVTFSRLYKDEAGWHSNDSFRVDDLLGIAKLADQTHSWIVQKQQEPE